MLGPHHDAHTPDLASCGSQAARDLHTVLVHGILAKSKSVHALRHLRTALLFSTMLLCTGCPMGIHIDPIC